MPGLSDYKSFANCSSVRGLARHTFFRAAVPRWPRNSSGSPGVAAGGDKSATAAAGPATVPATRLAAGAVGEGDRLDVGINGIFKTGERAMLHLTVEGLFKPGGLTTFTRRIGPAAEGSATRPAAIDGPDPRDVVVKTHDVGGLLKTLADGRGG